MKPSIKAGLRILFSGVLFAFLVWWIELDSILEAVRSVEPRFLAAALLLLPLSLGPGILMWWLLLRAIDPDATLRSASSAVFAGYSLALFTPARLGDAGARIYYHRTHGGVQVAAALATEGVYRAVAYLTGGSIALIVAIRSGILDSAVWTAAAAATVIAAGCSIFIAIRPSGIIGIVDRIPFASRASPHISFLNSISVRKISGLFFLSVARYVVMIAQLSLLMAGFGVTADHLQIVAGSGFVFLVKWTVPNLFFMDLGIREGAAAFVFDRMGGFGAAAVGAALCLYAINLVIPALLGVPHVRKTPDS